MKKPQNPLFNAFAAALYIVCIALLFHTFSTFLSNKPDTIFAPMTMLSLFVLSAAIMGFIFLSEPLQLLMENKKQEAIMFFGKVTGFFACFLLISLILLFIF